MVIFLIDFDNTITKSDLTYPNIDEIRPYAREVINKLYDNGHCIIINTCRTGESEDMARKWLISHDIKFCHINENCENRKERFNNDTRKLGGHIIIDDKSIECLYMYGKDGPDWMILESMINNVLENIKFKDEGLCKYRDYS